jgi:hypothetical protein
MQQNTTVQIVAGAPPGSTEPPADTDGQPVSGAAMTTEAQTGSQTTSSVNQIQFGCMSQCFGSATTSPAGQSLIPSALQQLVSALEAASAALPSPVPGIDQNSVQQSDNQLQSGAGGVQSEVAVQSNSTVQTIDLSSLLPAGLEATTGAPAAADGQTSNQTMQGIWQLQMGCVSYCVGTQQIQQAQQSNDSVEVIVAAAGTPTPGANTAVAIVWQIQIGCLFWCDDAVESQTATTTQSAVVMVLNPDPPPAVTPPSSSATGVAQPPSGSAGGPLVASATHPYLPVVRLTTSVRHRRARPADRQIAGPSDRSVEVAHTAVNVVEQTVAAGPNVDSVARSTIDQVSTGRPEGTARRFRISARAAGTPRVTRAAAVTSTPSWWAWLVAGLAAVTGIALCALTLPRLSTRRSGSTRRGPGRG